MVIYLQDVLARRRNEAAHYEARLLAVGGTKVSVPSPRAPQRQSLTSAWMTLAHEGPALAPLSAADAANLYAEASLI